MATLAGEGVIHYDLALRNIYAKEFHTKDPASVSVKVSSLHSPDVENQQ